MNLQINPAVVHHSETPMVMDAVTRMNKLREPIGRMQADVEDSCIQSNSGTKGDDSVIEYQPSLSVFCQSSSALVSLQSVGN